MILAGPARDVGGSHLPDHAAGPQLAARSADHVAHAAGSLILGAELEVVLVAIEDHFHSRFREHIDKIAQLIEAGRVTWSRVEWRVMEIGNLPRRLGSGQRALQPAKLLAVSRIRRARGARFAVVS